MLQRFTSEHNHVIRATASGPAAHAAVPLAADLVRSGAEDMAAMNSRDSLRVNLWRHRFLRAWRLYCTILIDRVCIDGVVLGLDCAEL